MLGNIGGKLRSLRFSCAVHCTVQGDFTELNTEDIVVLPVGANLGGWYYKGLLSRGMQKQPLNLLMNYKGLQTRNAKAAPCSL